MHPIKVVARRTGLTPHVIRAWEKRYHAVTPKRTRTNRRVYTDEDVERLLLLRRATLAGRSIGQIAEHPTERLRELVLEDERAQSRAPAPAHEAAKSSLSSGRLRTCLEAIEEFNPDALRSILDRASVELSKPALVEELIAPLLEKIGDGWHEGSLRVAHEHLASATIRTFLGDINQLFSTPPEAPRLIVTTPAGQIHELGSLVAAAAAASDGWHVTYLGPSLPAEEIAAAAVQNRSRAVALSIIYPPDDPHLKSELRRLTHLLPRDMAVLVGGRSSLSYAEVIEEVGAARLPDLRSFRSKLESLRSQPVSESHP